MDDSAPQVSRRAVLGAVGATATGALAGCSDRLWTTAEPSPHEQVSMTILTLPRDDDPMSTAIAGQLAENLRTAGVDAVHEPVGRGQLFRQILLGADFDAFVARHPGFDEPDSLYGLLHSEFLGESGWQNPFRFTDNEVDDALEAQRRRSGDERLSAFADLFDHLDGVAPYTTVAFPHHRSVARASIDLSAPPRTPLEYLELVANGGAFDGDDEDPALRVGVLQHGLEDRLNPIAIDPGELDPLVGLLYDPLVRRDRIGPIPWLAETVEWEESGGVREALVTLREGASWHDGESLTADDVAFTARFMEDTTLGEADGAIPAPRYRSQSALIDEAVAEDDRRVRITFSDCSKDVAERALTIPILPAHVWSGLNEPINTHLTEAIEWNNEDPVGSGLYAVVEASNERVEIEPFAEHPLQGVDVDGVDGSFEEPLVTAIEFRSVPNAGAAIESLRENDLDLVGSRLAPEELEHVEDGDGVSILGASTRSFHIVGYNLRHSELVLPQFRRIVSRLIDREYLVEDVLEGFAEVPTTVDGVLGFPPGEWDVPDRIPERVLDFPGTNGEVDAETVRALFEDANFRYDDDDLIA